MRWITLIFVAVTLFWGATACNGKSKYYDVTDALTDYSEVEVVDFSIAGTAVCKWCKEKGIDVTGLQIEVVPDNDVTNTLALKIYSGPGPFSFADLRYRSGITLTIYGRLHHGFSDAAVDTWVKVSVPDEDDEVVSCVLNFPEF